MNILFFGGIVVFHSTNQILNINDIACFRFLRFYKVLCEPFGT